MGLGPAEIVEEVKKFTAKQIVVIVTLVAGALSAISFVEDRYAKNKEIKIELENTRSDIKKINEEMKQQVTTLSVLVGQMSAILNSGSGRVVQPIAVPANAPPLTPEVLERIEAARPKVSGNEAAVDLQNQLIKQQAIITEQKNRLKQIEQK